MQYYRRSSELYHHGIKGMKWGVRRYQNSDGTLTPAGKKRYSDNAEAVEKASKNLKVAKDAMKKATSDWNKATLGGTVYNQKADYNLKRADKAYRYAKSDLRDEKLRDKLYKQKNKSKRQQSLEDKYKESGMTEEEAALAAYKRVRMEKTLAVVGGIALTTAAAYVAYKHYDRVVDKVIKSDTLLQNISRDSNKGIEDAFYAAANPLDKTKYRGMYAKQILTTNPMASIYNTTVKVGDKGIKVASPKSATDALKELVSNNSSFKKDLEDSLTELQGRLIFGAQPAQQNLVNRGLKDLQSGKITNNVYEALNFGLVNHTETGNRVSKTFYDALKSKGYDAIKDINDAKYSGYNSINPLIVFNGAEKAHVDSIQQVGRDVVEKTAQKAEAMIYGEAYVKQLAPIGAATAAVYGGVKLKDFISENTTSDSDLKTIRNYRKKHPNSELSDKEILRNAK